MSDPTYQKFIDRVKQIRGIGSTGAVLSWDQETQMPPKGAAGRADQMALLSGLGHDMLVSDEMGELLDKLGEGAALSDEQKVNVREIRRSFERERRVPTELVQELAKTQSLAHETWITARKNNSYPTFAPSLEKIISLRMQMAMLISGGSKDPSVMYDTLLDEFEPGAKSADLIPVFSKLRSDLVPLVARISSSNKKPAHIKGRYPIDKQRELGLLVAKAMGFDFEAGRLDVSAHPFCTAFSPNDVRITTRYEEGDMQGALFGTMHESGHALYEQGLPVEHAGTPLAEAAGMGIHESQSRLWENMVGRSREFWKFAYPKAQAYFPEALGGVSFDDHYLSVNVVKPTLIRTESDEVTYNLHILLRFELEQAVFAGKVSVSELPALWNKKMDEYLGVRPPNDAQGVLQDIHWSMGAFGYFPTYTLGNLYAAQFFAKAKQEVPNLMGKLTRGELLPLREWLRQKIHRHGTTYRAPELCKQVTGESLDAGYFTSYLKTKFGELYGV